MLLLVCKPPRNRVRKPTFTSLHQPLKHYSMTKLRPATHSGLWYSGDGVRLTQQINQFFQAAENAGIRPVKGARVLIGPHAGYTYLGARLAETFAAWDTTKVKRVFILGPLHHVYFKTSVMVSNYDSYETPIGNLPVDKGVSQALAELTVKGKSVFKYMTEEVDEDEHSFEMHVPFVYHKTRDLPQGLPLIVPIMISGLDSQLAGSVVEALRPYFADEENAFVISSDFCHWGSRFGYTEYVSDPSKGIEDLITLRLGVYTNPKTPIYKSIEYLDREAMRVASEETAKDWKQYISETGNTICGQKPIWVVLQLLEGAGKQGGFKWLGYLQSSLVVKASDSSVSYALGYVVL